MKSNGLREEHYFNEIAPKDTKMCLEATFSSHKSFVGLCFLDLANETFSQHHFHNTFRPFFDFKRVFENFRNGSIDFFKTLTIMMPDNVNNLIPKFHQHRYTGTLLNLSMKYLLNGWKISRKRLLLFTVRTSISKL